MSQLYARVEALERCQHSVAAKVPITIIGLTAEGDVGALAGIVQSVETGQAVYAGYPLRVTMPDSN